MKKKIIRCYKTLEKGDLQGPWEIFQIPLTMLLPIVAINIFFYFLLRETWHTDSIRELSEFCPCGVGNHWFSRNVLER